jgi:prepilin-type N-terminal cleavage/methylation domain-containing protein
MYRVSFVRTKNLPNFSLTISFKKSYTLMYMNKKGFTLLEIIIVITIIAVLATAGVGAYSGSLQRAKDSKKMANIEIIKQAVINYYNDNSDYPISFKDSTMIPKYLGNNFLNYNDVTYSNTASTPRDCSSGSLAGQSFCFSFALDHHDSGPTCDTTAATDLCASCNMYCVNEYGRIGR